MSNEGSLFDFKRKNVTVRYRVVALRVEGIDRVRAFRVKGIDRVSALRVKGLGWKWKSKSLDLDFDFDLDLDFIFVLVFDNRVKPMPCCYQPPCTSKGNRLFTGPRLEKVVMGWDKVRCVNPSPKTIFAGACLPLISRPPPQTWCVHSQKPCGQFPAISLQKQTIGNAGHTREADARCHAID